MEPTPSSTSASTSRSFSTAARIGTAPMAYRRPLIPLRWAVPATALVCAGFAANLYRESTAESRRTAAAEAAQEEAERLRRNEAIMDMYGDRSSLADLEKAATFYSKKP